jgi:hypothetical protein
MMPRSPNETAEFDALLDSFPSWALAGTVVPTKALQMKAG